MQKTVISELEGWLNLVALHVEPEQRRVIEVPWPEAERLAKATADSTLPSIRNTDGAIIYWRKNVVKRRCLNLASAVLHCGRAHSCGFRAKR